MKGEMKRDEVVDAAIDFIQNGGSLPLEKDMRAHDRFVFIASVLKENYDKSSCNATEIEEIQHEQKDQWRWIRGTAIGGALLLAAHLDVLIERADDIIKWIVGLLI